MDLLEKQNEQPKEVVKTPLEPQQIQSFFEMLNQLEKWIVLASETLVRMIDQDPQTIPILIKQKPEYDMPFYIMLQKIGRKQLHHRVALGTSSRMKYLEALPYEKQDYYLNNSFEVLVSNGESLLISLDNLTYDQCRQVFDGKKIRDLAGQRAWQESLAVKAQIQAPTKEEGPYTIRGGKVIILKPVELDKYDIKRIWDKLFP